MPSNQAYSWPQYSVCPFFSGWTSWSNKFIFILKNRLLTIFEMYFFGTGKKELSCSRLMERDIFNQRTDSESQGLSYLFIICISLWKNSFMKKLHFYGVYRSEFPFKFQVENYFYLICFWFLCVHFGATEYKNLIFRRLR